MSDDEGQAFFARIEFLEKDNESLRQQLADIKREWATADSHKEDYAEKLERQIADANRRAEYWKAEHLAGNEQLAERDVVIKDFAQIERGMEQELAECQAREKVLRDAMKLASIQYMGCGGNLLPGEIVDAMTRILNRSLDIPSDSTALDAMKKQWQREALLEAIEMAKRYEWDSCYVRELEKMAKELE